MSVFDGTICVDECYLKCPFFNMFGTLMDCNHPFFNRTCIDPMDNMIIEEDNCHGTVPRECPLRFQPFTGVVTIELALDD
jgi:hypothetical protein